MALTGVIGSASEASSIVPNVLKLKTLEPSAARFLAVYMETKKTATRVHSTKYETQERRPRTMVGAINEGAGYNTSATTFTLDDNTFLSVGDVVVNPRTEENYLVTDVDSGGTDITVTRAWGTVAAAALLDNDTLIRLGRTEREGWTVGESYLTATSQVTNYCSTIATPFEWTTEQAKTWSYLSDSQKQSRMKKDAEEAMKNHLRDIERIILASQRITNTLNGKTHRGTHGIIQHISTNDYDHGGSADMTETEFRDNLLAPVFKNGSGDSKFAFMSTDIMSLMEGYGLSSNRYHPDKTMSHKLGFEVSEYRSSFGNIKLVRHPLFDKFEGWLNEAILITDPMYCNLVAFEDTKHMKNVQPRNVMTRKDQFCTILGVEVTYEETMAFGYDLLG